MAVTYMSDMINPEVMGPMINAKIEAQLKLTSYAKVDTSLVGVPGDTKTVPSWRYIGDAEDVAEGVEVGTVKLTSDSTTFTIKKAMKSVSITQESINSGLGNPVAQAETQLAKAIAGKVDNDVVDAAYSGTNRVVGGDTLTKISYKPIVDVVCKFEDEENDIDKVMFIHPKQEGDLLKDDTFISADKFESGVAISGSIGKIAGCWIKKSKKVMLVEAEKNESGSITITAENLDEYKKKTLDGATLQIGDKVNALTTTNQYYLNPILKLEADSSETEYTEGELPAITIYLKKDTQTDHEWFPKKQIHDITSARYYGVAKTNDAKIVLGKFKK